MFQRRYTPDLATRRKGKHTPLFKQAQIVTEIPDLADLTHDAELRDILAALPATSAIVMPLRSRRQTLGSLTLLLAEAERRYGPTDMALVQELARRIARAVERSHLYDTER
jgi:GAF domain-containing protein